MKVASAALLFTFLGLAWSAPAVACRVPPRPAALRAIEADAIVLVRVTDVKVDGPAWRATGTSRGTLMGKAPARTFDFGSLGSNGEVVISSCDQSGPPKPGRYSVLYLRRTAQGLQVHRAYPYWWARASGDPRVAKLDRLLPLGAARAPKAEESRMLDLAEARIELPPGISRLSGYTRIYGRSSPGTVSGLLIRSRQPRRLIVDDPVELPTRDSCRCRPVALRIDLSDLLAAGRLPPFNP